MNLTFDPKVPFELPFLPPPVDPRDPDILVKLGEAKEKIAYLNGLFMGGNPNSNLLMAPLIAESVASSQIEGIHTTVTNVFQGKLFPESQRKPEDQEVIRYLQAMDWGFENLKSLSVSTRLIHGIHRKLVSRSSGEYRKQQNTISNSVTGNVLYTPPIASRIESLMGNWENFVNDQNLFPDFDPILKCAIAHYQFEAIHPFMDGNGRTGRILIPLQLVQSLKLIFPVFYISGYLNKHRPEYYDLLRKVTSEGAWKEYLLFMLTAFTFQAEETTQKVLRIFLLRNEAIEITEKKFGKIVPQGLIDYLFSNPVTTPSDLKKHLRVSFITASRYLERLKNIGILIDRKIGRYHMFFNHKLLDILSD